MDHSYWLLASTALLLGMRHGLDLDHLASIDAITRNTAKQTGRSKFSGLLFSFGHGLVVIIISLLIGSGVMRAYTPAWLDGFGNAISIFFLYLFALITIISLLQPAKDVAIPYGFKTFVTQKLNVKMTSPLIVILIGAIFAISFDTFSQVALFSLSASMLAGSLFSMTLGIVFMFGMMITDGLNGLVVSKLLCKANAMSQLLSRAAGWSIAIFSVWIATNNLIQGIMASA